ncbi:hypothetical protein MAPG_08834 [Magnaporthiopsis poae ATCC 64411]|uniref:Uncharacterized protein n=1 Tax=Magnaporthiopsis poae (strain ATCC 64411 / 73-15) TaxID=644358 RepID=A0A0C4E8D3_MAGP6|nr:hypothetical protein MAPG_08834 [Magnaporthiopsis poae ATCC 64411]
MPLSMSLARARSLCLISIFSTLATGSDAFITVVGNATASTFAMTSWINTQPAIPPFPPRNSLSVPRPIPPSQSRNVTSHNSVHISSAYSPTLTSDRKISGATYSSTSPHKPATLTTTTSYSTGSLAFPHWATWNTSAALGAGTASTAGPSANATTLAATTTSQDDPDYAIRRPCVTSSTKKTEKHQDRHFDRTRYASDRYYLPEHSAGKDPVVAPQQPRRRVSRRPPRAKASSSP